MINSEGQQAYSDSSIAVRLIPKLTSRSLENSDKQHLLGQVAGLTCDATAVALHVGEAPLVALNLLEEGRGVLAASVNDMRIDMFDLQERYPKLAEQFIYFRNELEQSTMRNTSYTDENRKSSLQWEASRRYDAGKMLDKLIDKIRKQPYFEDFLLPLSEKKFKAAAEYGPIVLINISVYRCDALIIERRRIRSLALERLNSKEIQENVSRSDLGSPRILEWLWDIVANPILDALGFTQPSSNDSYPHVWWIPTGPLSKFPLHAAGYHDEGLSRTVLDRVMSSYSSSVKTIIHTRSRIIPEATQSARPQALLVAMQNTPKSDPLPSATNEVAIVHHLCKSMALYPVEPGRRKQDIVSHLSNCKIFHFAGHGRTNRLDPSQSDLLVEDWESNGLTVANLLEINLYEHSPFLAYLSACGTGQIHDKRFFDESIHLVSAIQLAGFRHVIGTLWGVEDDLSQDIARLIYEGIRDGMRDGRMTDESVCRGLHKAIRELRNRWLSMEAKAQQRSRLAERVSREHENDAATINERDQQDRGQRPFVSGDSDEEGNTLTGSLNWVPYVHFGV